MSNPTQLATKIPAHESKTFTIQLFFTIERKKRVKQNQINEITQEPVDGINRVA